MEAGNNKYRLKKSSCKVRLNKVTHTVSLQSMVYPEGTWRRSRNSSWRVPEQCELKTFRKLRSADDLEKGLRVVETNLDTVSQNAPSTNQQFIQDRIRHLIDAFSTRAQAARDRVDSSTSSVSSNETIQPLQEQRVSICSNSSATTIIDPSRIEELDPSHTLCDNLKYILDNKVIDPNGKAYVAWISITAVSVIYNYWVIPLRSTFPYQNADNRIIWMCFDYLADLIYLIDLVLVQTRIKYLHEGFWVTDMRMLRMNYVKKTAFKLDVLSLLPLDLLYIVTGPDFVLMRFPRFFKIHSFWICFSFVDKLLSNPYIIRISKTLIYMMYLIHINACAYYAFSRWEGIGSNDFVYNGHGHPYIKCFYFATKTATSIGKNPKPTQEWEYIFMTFSWLMGVFVFAVLIGQIRDIISSANRQRTEYKKLVDETIEYMRKGNIPSHVQDRVKVWFNYTWKTQRTLDESKILDCLPHKMKTDIALKVHFHTLNKVTLFADCDKALLRELVVQLKSVIYLPGDIICKKGDVGKEMYIVQSGRVEVIGGANSDVLATLTEGSVFGEISLLGIPGMNRRTADVRSAGHSNLFVLSKEDLNEALKNYPEAQQILNKKAKTLMKKNAALEKKQEPVIVIENPSNEPKQSKLMDTVMKVLPPEAKSSRLLRFGSRGEKMLGPRPENLQFKARKSLPTLKYEFESRPRKVSAESSARKVSAESCALKCSERVTFETAVMVHRTMDS